VTYSKTPLRDYYNYLHLRRCLSVAISGRQSRRRGVGISPERRKTLSTIVHALERRRGEMSAFPRYSSFLIWVIKQKMSMHVL
jgi:hypothetical protein